MNLNDYTLFTRDTALYPPEEAINYLTLGLTSEAGEVAGKLKKRIRDGAWNQLDYLSELGDVLWYVARICDEMGITVEDLAYMNSEKLKDRMNRNALKGNGDNR